MPTSDEARPITASASGSASSIGRLTPSPKYWVSSAALEVAARVIAATIAPT